VGSINSAREKAKEEGEAITAGEGAFVAVPKYPTHDVGFILGVPSRQTTAALGQLGLRMAEIAQVTATATATALEAIWKYIWIPRCQAVKDTIGTWQQRTSRRSHLTRQEHVYPWTSAAGQPPASRHPPADRRRPEAPWDEINRLAFHTDRYQAIVDPSWRS
jgi:hypothetical protein